MSDATIAAEEAPEAPWARPFAYRGTSGAATKILVRNMLLGLVTLGIYRFWGKTRLRQYLWRHVTLLDDGFEYTGRGIELFYGFLIVVAVLFGVGLVFRLADLVFITAVTDAVSPIDLGYFLLLTFLVPYALFRARRYVLSRTRWRGVGLVQDGSPWSYAWLSLLGLIATAITLGIAAPARAVWLYQYRTTNTRLGNEAFTFDGRVAPLVKAWLVVIAAAVPSVVALGLSFAVFGSFPILWWELDFFGLAILLLPIVGLAYVWYRVVQYRYFVRNTRFSSIEARADIRVWAVVGRFALFYVVLFFLFIIMAVALGASGYFGSDPNSNVAFGAVVAFLILLMAVSVLRWLLVNLPLLRHLTEVLQVSDVAALDRVLQTAQEKAPQFGEGLADALDTELSAF